MEQYSKARKTQAEPLIKFSDFWWTVKKTEQREMKNKYYLAMSKGKESLARA